MKSDIIIYTLAMIVIFLKSTNNKVIKGLTFLSSFLVIISVIPMFTYKNTIANISYIILMISIILLIKETCITSVLKNKDEEYKILKIFLIISGFITLICTSIISIVDFNNIYARYLILIGSFMLFSSKNIVGDNNLKYFKLRYKN